MPPRMNIGFSRKQCTVPQKTPSLVQQDHGGSPKHWPQTERLGSMHVHRQHMRPQQSCRGYPCCPSYRWTLFFLTLFISLKTPKLNNGLNSPSPALSPSTFWGLLIGSWALISNGHVTTMKYWFTSVKPALRLTLLKTTASICGISLPMLHPYRLGLPIDACSSESNEADDCPALLDRKKRYQNVVGLIGWLAQSTRPDLTPSHSFLLSYNNKPSKSHGNAALYVLHYIHSTIDYGFIFTSKTQVPLHMFMLFP